MVCIEGHRHSLFVQIKTCCHQETTANPLSKSPPESIPISLDSQLPHQYPTIHNLNHAVAETIGVDVAP